MEDIPKHSVAGLVASLGGTLNLWIGVSFITVVEIIDLIYKLIRHIFTRKHGESKVESSATD